MVHAIRLREPWGIAQLPAETLELRRKFQCPPAVRAAERVWLAIAGLPGAIQVAVNGQVVAPSDTPTRVFRQDIRALLHDRNEIVIRLTLEDVAPQTLDRLVEQVRHDVLAAGLVRLEIE